jgi:flagellar export protein FliJ
VARRFQFRLATVLRVRALREREAQRRVARKRAELMRLDELDRACTAEIAAAQQALLGTQRGGLLDSLALTRSRAWIAHLRRQMVDRQRLREKAAAELRTLVDALRRARTETRALEKLRERRLADHKRAARLREQASADETARQLQYGVGGVADFALMSIT